MNRRLPNCDCRMNRRPRRRGFSFAEVMFAVVVLGIGFIMLASIFPVAIRQTASVVEENDGTALTKRAADQFREALINSGDIPNLPATAEPIMLGPTFVGYAPGRMFAFPDPRRMYDAPKPWDTGGIPDGPMDNEEPLATQNKLYAVIKSRMISADDGRYAFIPLYRRDRLADGRPSPWVQLTIVAVQNRTGRNYDPELDFPEPHKSSVPVQDFPDPDPSLNNDDELPTFWPRPVEVLLTEGVAEPDRITIRDIGPNDTPSGANIGLAAPDMWRAAAEGAYVVISDSRVPPGPAGSNVAAGLIGRSNGRVYRLGNEVPAGPAATGSDQVTFELVPGEDMAFDDGPDNTIDATLGGDDIHEQLPIRPVNSPDPATGWAYAFIVGGRPMKEPTKPFDRDANPYEGLAQAMTAFTTFIQVK